MMLRRLAALALVAGLVAGCATAPPPAPAGSPSESESVSLVEEARAVATRVEQRTIQIDATMRDPFARP